MAKRGTLTHRRTRRLAASLGLAPYAAMGLLEALWHVTAENAPRGDVGRLSDQDLADEVYWQGEPAELVAGLVAAGALEAHAEHRLVVHGWSEHADNALRHRLARAGLTFWDGATPFRPKAAHDQSATDHVTPPASADTARLDENWPASASNQSQQPATSTTNNAPPGPPTPVENPPRAANGTNGAGGYRVGDVLTDGREVLEVDEHGRPLVVAREGVSPPELIASTADPVVARLVEYGARIMGYRFDRAARRRLRERLIGGETEAQIRARWDATRAALEEEPPEPPPGAHGPGDDPELAQALGLLPSERQEGPP